MVLWSKEMPICLESTYSTYLLPTGNVIEDWMRKSRSSKRRCCRRRQTTNLFIILLIAGFIGFHVPHLQHSLYEWASGCLTWLLLLGHDLFKLNLLLLFVYLYSSSSFIIIFLIGKNETWFQSFNFLHAWRKEQEFLLNWIEIYFLLGWDVVYILLSMHRCN